jgi:hypothetical protein
MWKPAVGRGLPLPEFADAVALPAAHGGANFYRRNLGSQTVGQRPQADLGPIQCEAMQARRLRGGKTIRTWRGAMKPFAQKVQNGLRPGRGMIATRVAGHPV